MVLWMMHSVSLYCDYSVRSEMRDAERVKEESVGCMMVEVLGGKSGLYSDWDSPKRPSETEIRLLHCLEREGV